MNNIQLQKKLQTIDAYVQKYIIKKKRQILCNVLLTLGANINLTTSFPMRISLSELETEENQKILDFICKDTIINKYFSCRSLKPVGSKDKKRIQNVIKQMATECNLNVTRSPLTLYNKLTNDKTTKQFYVISLNNDVD